MGQSVIGALRVNLGLDSAKFERGARRVNTPLATMKKQFLAVAAVAAAAGTAISAAALSGARDIDKAAKAARRLDASVGGFRALELAADEAGVNLSSLTSDIQTMNREIASIGVSGNGKRALDALGLSIDDLAGKDADERLAIIADQVKALGLSSGQTTAILRDLGVRNREMVLLVAQGGDVIRQARRDMESYGLAGQRVDDMAPAMERANDAMGRLGLIGRYLRQELARELVPAMGDFASSMTDSLRAGGVLRGMIDGLAGNIKRIGTYLAVAVTGFGVRYVGALVAAKVATLSFSGSLLVLRGALIRSGFGLLIVGAGELVYQFSKLVTATGGFRSALSSVFAVGKAVFLGIGNTAWGLMEIMAGVASAIAGSFVRAFAEIGKAWDLVANGMAATWNAVAGSTFGEKLGLGNLGKSDLGGTIQGAADSIFDGAEGSIRSGGQRIKAAGQSVADAIGGLKILITGTTEEVDDGSAAADRYAAALDKLGDSANGGSGGINKVKDATSELRDGLKSVESSAQSAFSGLVTGAKSAKEALSDVLKSFASMLANQVFNSLFSPFFSGAGAGGGLLSGLLSFDGGGYTGAGARMGGVDGRGGFPALLHPNETVIDHTKGQSMGGQSSLHVTVGVEDDGKLIAVVRNEAGKVVAQSVPDMMDMNSRQTGHNLQNHIARND